MAENSKNKYHIFLKPNIQLTCVETLGVQTHREYISYHKRLRKPVNAYYGTAKTCNVLWVTT